MKKITIEDIDKLAMEIKEKFCTSSVHERREQFEYDVFQYLKEALDPWREK